MALHNAGASGGTGGSPAPVGASGMMRDWLRHGSENPQKGKCGVPAGWAHALERFARRRMAHSHIRRIKLLPGEIRRQYCANFLRAWASVAWTRVSVVTRRAPARCPPPENSSRPATLPPRSNEFAKLVARDELIELGSRRGD